MAIVIAGPVVSLAALLHSKDGPVGLSNTVAWLPTLVGIYAIGLWIWHWPSHTEFMVFAVACSTSIALTCLVLPDPRSSLISTYAFMIAGSLLALFQSPRLMLYNFALVTVVVGVNMTELIGNGQFALAAVALIGVLLANILVPLGIFGLVNQLGTDLVEADRDPLTGLFNRRAFRNETLNLALSHQRSDAWLVIVLIDLDRFKAVNDTYGHDAGDRVLARVAQELLTSAGPGTVVSRNGGEEFVVAAIAANDTRSLAQRICDAIASAEVPVTASVGSASARVDDLVADDLGSRLEELMAAADSAMYHAKRNGGNQTCHHSSRPVRQRAAEEPGG